MNSPATEKSVENVVKKGCVIHSVATFEQTFEFRLILFSWGLFVPVSLF